MRNNETGRSMVEMLGVLAIIGVLSVAGIAGYTMAMRKYRSNEILNTASQCAVLARTYQGVGLSASDTADCLNGTGTGIKFKLSAQGASAMTAENGTNPGEINIEVTTGTDADLCKSAATTAGAATTDCDSSKKFTKTFTM